ncbi:outer membrane receptor protein involved in Fe transport [Caulobacter rhizosphaerae]|uniref:Outer membrane receptor protein involved in Fe transport n=1 Tax=Caulobacter rhizosphaerae TaxID=2010972 RepID=A0ABU1N3A6_9CAUL|nr:TonB-dependent receptor plug domain-containing protein [Caulobacter rhizosphaerae]MDR6532813.1 outer membrane receptor protein involved in Fe transport [Caulobacter rhizosphaerae]
MASIAVSALAFSQGAHAQQADTKADKDNTVDAVIVTGTRIRRPNVQSAAPIVTMDKQELQFQGVMNIEDALNRLPQVRADNNQFGAGFDNGGQAKVNLRRLGNQRTLVLLDGERLLPVQAIDLNIVPVALISRVDVLSGGASSTYGSDAVAGVVNFVLNKKFDGVQVNGSYSFFQHTNDDMAMRGLISQYPNFPVPPQHVTDGGRWDINFAAGKNFADDKGNISIFADYRDQKPVKWSARDYSSCRVAGSTTALSCSVNTSYTPFGRLDIASGPNAGNGYFMNKDGTQSFVSTANAADYASNTRKDWNFIRSDKRFTGGLFANYHFNDALEAYANLLVMRDVSIEQQSGAFDQDVSISCNNPFLSASQGQSLCGSSAGTAATVDAHYYLLQEGPGSTPVQNRIVNADYRFSGGLKGDLFDGWHYDVNFIASRVENTLSDRNEINPTRFARAVNVVSVGGTPTCQSVVDKTDTNCVAANIFQANKIDPKVYPYVYDNYRWTNVVEQRDVTANITGDLGQYGIKSPWAKEGVAVALGAEYRRESLKVLADQATVDYEGWFSTTGGHYGVKELYGEAQLPIANDLPFVKSLVFNTGLRASKYDNQKKELYTSKVEGLYRPVSDLLVRFSYNSAARAPNISELYSPRNFSYNGVDPCSATSLSQPGAPTAAQCANTGVTAAQYTNKSIADCGPNGCRRYAGGGNINLLPEKAITQTLGLVYTPSFVPGLMFSIDHVDIKIKDFIGYIDANVALSNCLTTGLDYYCRFVKRDPTTGRLDGTSATNGFISGGTENTNILNYKANDIQVGYNFGIGKYGRMDLNLVGTLLIDSMGQDSPTTPAQDCAGYYGQPSCYAPAPKWAHNARATWSTPWRNSNISLAWRYIGDTKLSANSTDNALNGGAGPQGYKILTKMKAYSYFDLAASVMVVKDMTARIAINNVFDKSPPVVPATFVDGTTNNPNTYTGLYDPLGRAVNISLQYNF